jgi:pilus assembly protein CpaC
VFLTGRYKAVSILIPALLVAGSPGTPPGPEEYAKASSAAPMLAQAQAVTPAPGTAGPSPTTTRDLFVTVGKSLIVDSPVNIQRVSVANSDLAEAVAVNPREVLVNGKAPGETSLIVWQQGGNRLFFDLTVRRSNTRIDLIQQELNREVPGQDVTVTVENDTAFLRGTVRDLVSADRAVAIATSLGKVVNLLNVNVPGAEPQILLKVRFANVDRAATSQLGLNLFSTGALNTIGSTTTGQFSPPRVQTSAGGAASFTLTDALNIFLFRPDLNVGATIAALQSRRLLEVLAEPNVLAINGKPASFLAGGEFPYPTLQGGGGGLGAVTIAFREFGVRINVTPNITPRGTIRLQVTPEVSSLDFANGLTFQGFTIPALSTRRVQTEIELDSGQSFAIGGLLDNRVTEQFNKIPGIGDIPILGKLFQSKQSTKSNTELLVLVTPELVRPIPAGQPVPEIKYPVSFLQGAPTTLPRTPGMDVTGPVPVKPPQESIPVETLVQSQQKVQSTAGPSQAQPQIQFVPIPLYPPQPQPSSPPVVPLPAPQAAAPAK